MPASETALREMLAMTNFPAELGIELDCAGDGACVLWIAPLEKTKRPGNIMSGYVLVGAADVAAWLAIKTLLGVDDGSVTSDLHTVFVRAAAGRIRCRARVVRCGRRLVVVDVESDADGKVVARHAITYARRD